LGNSGGGNGGFGSAFFATSAIANTGSGGGAASGNAAPAGNGGSGIVIIRYPATASPPVATTGNPQISYAGGYQIYTWTSSGSVTF
jgi:hypothetical protein